MYLDWIPEVKYRGEYTGKAARKSPSSTPIGVPIPTHPSIHPSIHPCMIAASINAPVSHQEKIHLEIISIHPCLAHPPTPFANAKANAAKKLKAKPNPSDKPM